MKIEDLWPPGWCGFVASWMVHSHPSFSFPHVSYFVVVRGGGGGVGESLRALRTLSGMPAGASAPSRDTHAGQVKGYRLDQQDHRLPEAKGLAKG